MIEFQSGRVSVLRGRMLCDVMILKNFYNSVNNRVAIQTHVYHLLKPWRRHFSRATRGGLRVTSDSSETLPWRYQSIGPETKPLIRLTCRSNRFNVNVYFTPFTQSHELYES